MSMGSRQYILPMGLHGNAPGGCHRSLAALGRLEDDRGGKGVKELLRLNPLPAPGTCASRARGRRDRPAAVEPAPRAPRGRKMAPQYMYWTTESGGATGNLSPALGNHGRLGIDSTTCLRVCTFRPSAQNAAIASACVGRQCGQLQPRTGPGRHARRLYGYRCSWDKQGAVGVEGTRARGRFHGGTICRGTRGALGRCSSTCRCGTAGRLRSAIGPEPLVPYHPGQ